MLPTVTTDGLNGEISRLIRDCRATRICPAARMGSTERLGIAPCPPRPRTRMVKASALANVAPARTPTCPTGRLLMRCRAITASTSGFLRAPSSIMGCAPPIRSSAGWKRNFTLPCSASRCCARMSATVRPMATWPSWPQACILPGTCDLKGRSFSSWTGRASMSARIASVLPGWLPRSTPTTPVLPTPVRTSRPLARRRSAMMPAVRTSSIASSGCWCRSRRTSISVLWRWAISCLMSIDNGSFEKNERNTGKAWTLILRPFQHAVKGMAQRPGAAVRVVERLRLRQSFFQGIQRAGLAGKAPADLSGGQGEGGSEIEPGAAHDVAAIIARRANRDSLLDRLLNIVKCGKGGDVGQFQDGEQLLLEHGKRNLRRGDGLHDRTAARAAERAERASERERWARLTFGLWAQQKQRGFRPARPGLSGSFEQQSQHLAGMRVERLAVALTVQLLGLRDNTLNGAFQG